MSTESKKSANSSIMNINQIVKLEKPDSPQDSFDDWDSNLKATTTCLPYMCKVHAYFEVFDTPANLTAHGWRERNECVDYPESGCNFTTKYKPAQTHLEQSQHFERTRSIASRIKMTNFVKTERPVEKSDIADENLENDFQKNPYSKFLSCHTDIHTGNFVASVGQLTAPEMKSSIKSEVLTSEFFEQDNDHEFHPDTSDSCAAKYFRTAAGWVRQSPSNFIVKQENSAMRCQPRASNNNYPKLVCEKCNKSISIVHFNEHFQRCRVPEDQKLVRCFEPSCGKMFATEKDRNIHASNVHSSPVQCPIDGCNVRVKKNSLQRHLKLVHAHEKAICDKCHRKVIYTYLQRHLAICRAIKTVA